jgi:hypothetical protein
MQVEEKQQGVLVLGVREGKCKKRKREREREKERMKEFTVHEVAFQSRVVIRATALHSTLLVIMVNCVSIKCYFKVD